MSGQVTFCFACACGVWSAFIALVQAIGVSRLFYQYSAPPPRAAVEDLPDEAVPHVTVIRPVKGLEPALYDCLASTFEQTYPRSRLSVHLCVEDRDDPAYPVLERVVAAYAGAVDARIFVEAEDPLLHGAAGHEHNLGPNPKIRNISRAYREARGDVVWIIDCNVWVAPGVAGRMVDKLFGFRRDPAQAGAGAVRPSAAPYKFVHQLPLVVDVTDMVDTDAADTADTGAIAGLLARGGARLDEMFMATSHAKFYSAINTVGVAPCIVGKSNMFRRSHLDALTDPAQNPTVLTAADASRGRGIDFFSAYICEDHLIGDLLWRSPVPSLPGARPYRNHGLVAGDLAVQPMAHTSVYAYVARRVRWLRVRKWTVLLATLVEPGVESLLCCFYASFALTTLAERFLAPATVALLGLQPTWTATRRGWAIGVALWMVMDWFTYSRLQTCMSIDVVDDPSYTDHAQTTPGGPGERPPAATPKFARGRGRASYRRGGRPPRPFASFLAAWLGRELLALPIWTWAVVLGTTVSWRGKMFRVRLDMSVVEIEGQEGNSIPASMTAVCDTNGDSGAASAAITTVTTNGKHRID